MATTKKTAKKAIKKAVKKAKKAVKKAAKKTSKKKAVKKVVKKTTKKATKKAAKKVTKKPAKKVAKKPVKKIAEKPAKKAAKKAVPASDFSIKSKISRQKDVAWRMIEGEAVIITPSDSTMHTLNETGTRIWELIDGARSLGEVAEALQAEFEVDEKKAREDTLWFAECLAKKGLVETD